MNTEKLTNELIKAVKIIDGLSGDKDDSVFVHFESYETRISFFPSDEYKESAVRYALSLCSKMEKDSDGNMSGYTQGIKLTLYSVLSCKIIDYKTTKKEIMQGTGQYEDIKEPIYECVSPLVNSGGKNG